MTAGEISDIVLEVSPHATSASPQIQDLILPLSPDECLGGAIENVPEGERASAGSAEAAGVADEDEAGVEVQRGGRRRKLEPHSKIEFLVGTFLEFH